MEGNLCHSELGTIHTIRVTYHSGLHTSLLSGYLPTNAYFGSGLVTSAVMSSFIRSVTRKSPLFSVVNRSQLSITFGGRSLSAVNHSRLSIMLDRQSLSAVNHSAVNHSQPSITRLSIIFLAVKSLSAVNCSRLSITPSWHKLIDTSWLITVLLSVMVSGRNDHSYFHK